MERKIQKKPLMLNLPEDVHKDLKVMAAYKEMSMTMLVLDLIKEELEKFKTSKN